MLYDSPSIKLYITDHNYATRVKRRRDSPCSAGSSLPVTWIHRILRHLFLRLYQVTSRASSQYLTVNLFVRVKHNLPSRQLLQENSNTRELGYASSFSLKFSSSSFKSLQGGILFKYATEIHISSRPYLKLSLLSCIIIYSITMSLHMYCKSNA